MTINGNTDIYVMNPDGSAVRRLTTSPAEDEFPAWSPDGRTIAYDSSGSTPLDSSGFSSTQEIWSVPADGGSPVRLTNNTVPDQAPTWSPDGSQIAFFHGLRFGDGTISVIGASGGAIRSIGSGPIGSSPRWSPDGTRIAYLYFGRNLRATLADSRAKGRIYSLPLADVRLVNVSSGAETDLPVQVPTSTNPVSWLPSSNALLVDRYTP